MSQDSLALKYRPRRFEEVVGQEVVVGYFSELIRRGKRPRNAVVYGPWGSGKTTTARIYAQSMHCSAPEENGSPCMRCESCGWYAQDPIAHPDYREFDGSTNGGKAEIKAELEIAAQPPMFSDFRIFIIDEAQGISPKGYDAMLKIVEEPPPWAIFIFLTTEVDKVRAAIKSRCALLEVKLLSDKHARDYVGRVADGEGFNYEPQALDLLVHLSGGHSRDLLKNLEQVAEGGDVTVERVRDSFSLGHVANLLGYVRATLDGDILRAVEALRAWSEPPEGKLVAVQGFFTWLYYREVLHIELRCDPAWDLVPDADRKALVDRIKKRIDDPVPSAVDAAFQAILKFWGDVRTVASEVAFELQVLRFNHLVNDNNFRHGNLPNVQFASSASSQKPTASRGRDNNRAFNTNPFDPEYHTARGLPVPSQGAVPAVGAGAAFPSIPSLTPPPSSASAFVVLPTPPAPAASRPLVYAEDIDMGLPEAGVSPAMSAVAFVFPTVSAPIGSPAPPPPAVPAVPPVPLPSKVPAVPTVAPVAPAARGGFDLPPPFIPAPPPELPREVPAFAAAPRPFAPPIEPSAVGVPEALPLPKRQEDIRPHYMNHLTGFGPPQKPGQFHIVEIEEDKK